MKSTKLIARSVLHYWRTNLAVVLGVVVATAVIGGALMVGDSVRDSLRDMTLKRLGAIDMVVQSPRFFRQELVEWLQSNHHRASGGGYRFAPAIWLSGSVEAGDRSQLRRVTNANVVGADDRLWQLIETGSASPPQSREVVLGARVAEELDVSVGDKLRLWVEIPESVPRETLLGEREEVAQEVAVTVSAILKADDGASRLDLRPGQQLPMTVYVDLTYLQESIGLDEVRRSRRNPDGRPARVNTMFLATRPLRERLRGTGRADAARMYAQESGVLRLTEPLKALLQAGLRPADLGLRVRPNRDRGYVSFETDSLVLDSASVQVIDELVSQMRTGRDPSIPYLRSVGSPTGTAVLSNSDSRVSVYLANSIANARDDQGGEDAAERCYSSYSVIAGINPPQDAPLGPWFASGQPVAKLADDEILINDWLAEDAQVGLGDQVRVRYFLVGSEGEGADGGLKEADAVFTVAGVLPLESSAANDPFLTPHVPGITDADSISEWEQPFEMDMDRITERDDEYWERYKATPKAFVNLSVAEKLWGSRHGTLTSVRVPVLAGAEAEAVAAAAASRPIVSPSPAELGLSFRPIRLEGLRASSGANDFTGLFIGFSFFLIAAAAILIGLLFRLGVDRRTTDVGLLGTIGFTEARVRRVFVAEGLLLILVALGPGLLAAIGYAALMMYGLRTWWVGATGTQFLHLSVRPMSLVSAASVSLFVSLLVVWLSVRRLRGYSAKDLLTGAANQSAISESGGSRRPLLVCLSGLLLGAGLLIATTSGVVPASEAFSGLSWQVVSFFVLAIAMLVSGVAGLAWWLQSGRMFSVRPGVGAMSRLGLRNASRHRSRSLYTVGLIAFAAFVIVAVAAGRRNPSAEFPDRDSGNGGFSLVAESSQPVLHDFDTADGREKLGFTSDVAWPDGLSTERFRVREGEDGSCLNLYQTRLPTVLGVPASMIQRGGFRFADTPSENPWQLLTGDAATKPVDVVTTVPDPQTGAAVTKVSQTEVPVYPVIGDMNTLQFSLKKGIGDLIPVPSDAAPEYAFEVVGMLDSSVFQGVLLLSEEHFRTLYPEVPGHRYFLIEVPASADVADVSSMLETQLTPYGLDAERVVDRIAGFLAVQNTYLSTFQTLGGLGLLLGTLGLGTVMLRNIIERRSELALMRSVGFSGGRVMRLVLVENCVLLVVGLVLGSGCALLAMTPHLQKTGADVPWGSLMLIVVGVYLTGMIAAWFAVREAIRTPVLSTLRSE